MVLEQRQIYRPIEQNREPRNKPSLMQSKDLQQEWQNYTMGKC